MSDDDDDGGARRGPRFNLIRRQERRCFECQPSSRRAARRQRLAVRRSGPEEPIKRLSSFHLGRASACARSARRDAARRPTTGKAAQPRAPASQGIDFSSLIEDAKPTSQSASCWLQAIAAYLAARWLQPAPLPLPALPLSAVWRVRANYNNNNYRAAVEELAAVGALQHQQQLRWRPDERRRAAEQPAERADADQGRPNAKAALMMIVIIIIIIRTSGSRARSVALALGPLACSRSPMSFARRRLRLRQLAALMLRRANSKIALAETLGRRLF